MKKHLRIVIIGVGNLLCQDEGVGIHVIRELERMKLPPEVEVVDCGSAGLLVLDAMNGATKAIVIDAAKAGGEPGDVLEMSVEEIMKAGGEKSLKLVSPHQFDLMVALKIGRLSDVYDLPEEIVIIGIEPKSLEFGSELSNEVKRAIPKVIDLIKEHIKKL